VFFRRLSKWGATFDLAERAGVGKKSRMAKVRETLMHTRAVRGGVAGPVVIGPIVIGPERIPVVKPEAKKGITMMPMGVAIRIAATPIVLVMAEMGTRRVDMQAVTLERTSASRGVFCEHHHH
jgi:hypothetical protein